MIGGLYAVQICLDASDHGSRRYTSAEYIAQIRAADAECIGNSPLLPPTENLLDTALQAAAVPTVCRRVDAQKLGIGCVRIHGCVDVVYSYFPRT